MAKKPGMKSPTPPRKPTHHGQTANLPVVHTGGAATGRGGNSYKKPRKGGKR